MGVNLACIMASIMHAVPECACVWEISATCVGHFWWTSLIDKAHSAREEGRGGVSWCVRAKGYKSLAGHSPLARHGTCARACNASEVICKQIKGVHVSPSLNFHSAWLRSRSACGYGCVWAAIVVVAVVVWYQLQCCNELCGGRHSLSLSLLLPLLVCLLGLCDTCRRGKRVYHLHLTLS